MRNFLVKFNSDAAADVCLFKKSFCRADNQIFVADRHRWIVTTEIDPARLPLDVDLVGERNRRDQCLDLMKAVITTPQNFQGEINLSGSENLHCVDFNCHVEPTQ